MGRLISSQETNITHTHIHHTISGPYTTLINLHIQNCKMVESSSECSVSLTANFSFPEGVSSEVEQKFDASNCQPARLGLPAGVEAVKPKGGDYSYSGMHDHGKLPEPKEGGDMALLLSMVREAQKNSDELLTRIIKEEKNIGRKPKDMEIETKKQKT